MESQRLVTVKPPGVRPLFGLASTWTPRLSVESGPHDMTMPLTYTFQMMFSQDVANIRVTSSHDKWLRDNRLGLYVARGQFAKTASIAKPML